MESGEIGCGWQLVGSKLSIHAVKKRVVDFSSVKSIAFITLELVDKVHRLAVCMSSYGVSEIDT